MNKNFDIALRDAYEKDFCWLNGFENSHVEHEFSSHFEVHMKDITSKVEIEFTLVRKKKRMQKRLLIALIALMALAIASCFIIQIY